MRTLLVGVLTLALLAPAALVAAENEGEHEAREGISGIRDGDHREDSDDRDDRMERHERFDLDSSDHHAEIRMTREANGAEHKVAIVFNTSPAHLAVRHSSEGAGIEDERKLTARFHALLEYVDGNNNSRYDLGEDVASAWRLGAHPHAPIGEHMVGAVDWEPLVVGNTTSADGKPGQRITARATFAGQGAFGLDIKVFGDFAQVDGATLQPTEAKVDIRIEHYPYVRNGTALALVLTTESKREVEHESDDDEEGAADRAAVNGTQVDLVFTWLKTASVDGADKPVGTTVLRSRTSTETEYGPRGDEAEVQERSTFALSYPRGDVIVHDPVVGARYGAASAGFMGVPAAGFALAAVAVAGVALAAQRRKR